MKQFALDLEKNRIEDAKSRLTDWLLNISPDVEPEVLDADFHSLGEYLDIMQLNREEFEGRVIDILDEKDPAQLRAKTDDLIVDLENLASEDIKKVDDKIALARQIQDKSAELGRVGRELTDIYDRNQEIDGMDRFSAEDAKQNFEAAIRELYSLNSSLLRVFDAISRLSDLYENKFEYQERSRKLQRNNQSDGGGRMEKYNDTETTRGMDKLLTDMRADAEVQIRALDIRLQMLALEEEIRNLEKSNQA